ncbi:hypothetical protein [Ferrimicrobium sp.]|uniref:hypothetical protein n=1 Tax=Ferrimicrobium sp. TaxID=2926050 RepID=UPI00263646AE|nr:hypothetical protein [Ferrimicrobium sp.]
MIQPLACVLHAMNRLPPIEGKHVADEAAFLRSEFDGCGETRSGVDKAIRGMVQDGELLRVGYGAYVRARRMISPVTKEPMIGTIVVPEVWAWQTLRKLGVDP